MSKLYRNVDLRLKMKANQETQLLQRGRASLRVVENFAKSLEVTEGHSKLHR